MFTMNYKLLILVGLLSALIVVAGCGVAPGKSLAGQATYDYEDNTQCVKNKWFYEDASGEEYGPFKGCTEFSSPGEPWCPIKVKLNKNAQSLYVTGGKYNVDWKFCEPSEKLECAPVIKELSSTQYTLDFLQKLCESESHFASGVVTTIYSYYDKKDCQGNSYKAETEAGLNSIAGLSSTSGTIGGLAPGCYNLAEGSRYVKLFMTANCCQIIKYN